MCLVTKAAGCNSSVYPLLIIGDFIAEGKQAEHNVGNTEIEGPLANSVI